MHRSLRSVVSIRKRRGRDVVLPTMMALATPAHRQTSLRRRCEGTRTDRKGNKRLLGRYRRTVRARASTDGEGKTEASVDENVPLVELRRAKDMESSSAFSGISAVDRGDDPVDVIKRIALLVACDASALLVFSAIGRTAHSSSDGSLLATAAPFLIAWFVTGVFTESYGAEARGGDVGAAAGVAAKTWAVATPVGLVLRAIAKGRVPPKPFVVVSMVATAVLLVGTRVALAWAAEQEPQSRREVIKSRKNRKANPLEIFTLIGGLTKRW
eukprot:scaffold2044_cov305-Pavlova_lutheri.AAC.13